MQIPALKAHLFAAGIAHCQQGQSHFLFDVSMLGIMLQYQYRIYRAALRYLKLKIVPS